ncbi:MAG: YIP1 family protein [Ignavibacteria bacterium]|nr:YIP1 family protein [Ignavibacteria bacterium]MBI3787578.1 YIP1 family protein [Ignavibacteriales bacterium]
MEQEQSVASNTAPAVSSFMTRVTDVFTAPSDVYTEVAEVPVQTSSWMLPWVISLLLAIGFTYALYNNTTLRQQIFEMQEQGWKKAVAEGKMTQEQYDQFSERMESSGPVMFMLFGAGSQIVGLSVIFFGAGLVFWLVLKFGLKFSGSYTKMLEVLGLASVIGILGSIITLLMMNLFDSFYAGPSASLAVLGSFDPTNKVHRLLASLNVFTLWEVAVLGIGMANISRKSVNTGLGVAFGLWAVWAIVSSLLGWGMR